jgi:GR25 family glycosyltransferase involved in LPS biosynthesis
MVDKFYMCHYTKLTERKEYALSELSKHNISAKWITKFDKEYIDYDNLTQLYPKILDIMPQFDRKMSKPEISLCLKHIEAFRDAIDNNYQNIVVFEDDIILVENFNDKLQSYMNQLPNDYDILWIGTCCDLHSTSQDGINIYTAYSSRCTHAYLISNSGCRKMISALKYLNSPIDWYFNFVIKNLNLKNYWAEPDLSRQELKFESAINAGNVE